jgi:cell wall-associated NlpC family hydrolase
VRKSASTSSASLGYLQKGTKVTITGTTGNFYKITYNGKTAYVSKSYVSTGSSSSTSSSSSKSAGQAVVDYAIQFVGNPYVTGGTSLTRGADCSGFVMSVYKKFGVSLPHSSYAMRSYGKAVSRSNIQPGDVICYSGHVAIYVGNGRTVAARNSRAGIGYSNAWYTSVITIRRFV